MSGNAIVINDIIINEFETLIDNILMKIDIPLIITEIIREEMNIFFVGDKTAEETAKIIQNRVSIYLSENR